MTCWRYCLLLPGSRNSEDFWKEGHQSKEHCRHQPVLPLLPGKILSSDKLSWHQLTFYLCRCFLSVLFDLIFDAPLWLCICCRRRTMSRLSGMQTSPCLPIDITLEHWTTKAAQCSSNKTTRRLPNSLKKHSEMTLAAQRPSTIWVPLVVLNDAELRTHLLIPSIFLSVGSQV